MMLRFLFIIAVLFFAETATATLTLKEKILTDRLNRVVQLDHASKALEKQMDNHNNGVKVLDNQRLKSIKTRLNSYAAQINESSRTLSPQELDELLLMEGKKIDAEEREL